MQIVKTREVKNLNLFTREKMYAYQPPPKALRFSHGRGERETSDWWWTAGDHGKGTHGRRSARLASCLLPAFLCAHIFIKRDVWVRGSMHMITGHLNEYFPYLIELKRGRLKSELLPVTVCFRRGSILSLVKILFSFVSRSLPNITIPKNKV